MFWRAALGSISGLVYIAATIPYIRAAQKRRVQPNLVSWGGGAVINAIAFIAQITKEPSWSVVIAGVTACYCVVVMVLTWRNGERTMGRFDTACLVLGIAAIIAWQLSNLAEIALVLSVCADAVLCAPMLRKTKRFPSSEIPLPFLLAAFAAVLSAAAAKHFDAVSLTWPCWIFFINGMIGVLALRAPVEAN